MQTEESNVEWKTKNQIFQAALNYSLTKLKRQNFLINLKNKKKDKTSENEVEDEAKENEEDDYSSENEEEQNSDKHLQCSKNNNKINEILKEKPLIKESFDLNENDPDNFQKKFFFGISADDDIWEI